MATEAPLLHHSQTTASTNMSSTAGLAGPNGSGQFLIMQMSGARTVAPSAVASGTTVYAGVLQNDPTSGFVADIGFQGVTKVVVGSGGVTAGSLIGPDSSGRAVTIAAGSGTYVIGIALDTTTTLGQIGTALITTPGWKA